MGGHSGGLAPALQIEGPEGVSCVPASVQRPQSQGVSSSPGPSGGSLSQPSPAIGPLSVPAPEQTPGRDTQRHRATDPDIARVLRSAGQPGTIGGKPGHLHRSSSARASVARAPSRRRRSQPAVDLQPPPYDIEANGHVRYHRGLYVALRSASGDTGDLPPGYRSFFRPLHPRRDSRLPRSLRAYNHTLDGYCLEPCPECSAYSCSRCVSFSHFRSHSGHECPGCH